MSVLHGSLLSEADNDSLGSMSAPSMVPTSSISATSLPSLGKKAVLFKRVEIDEGQYKRALKMNGEDAELSMAKMDLEDAEADLTRCRKGETSP